MSQLPSSAARLPILAAQGLLSGLSFRALLADRGFDGDRLWALLAALGAEAVVPTKSNRWEAIDCDMEKYWRRHRVENFFCRIKHFRRIVTRYDQTESSYAAMIRIAAVWLALAQLSTRPISEGWIRHVLRFGTEAID